MMTTKQIKQRLLLATAGLVIAALGTIVWGLFIPITVTGSARATTIDPTNGMGDSSDGATGEPSLQQLQALARIDLRRPLKDPPPPPPPLVRPLQAKLLGTVVMTENPESSMAMFKLADGSEPWISIGQTFNDPVGTVKLLKVGDKSATLLYRGQEQEVKASER